VANASASTSRNFRRAVCRGDTACCFLVFGERTTNDIVVYPEHNVMLVKAMGRKQFITKPFRPPGAPHV
jgi:uncharacterized cupin superfamily protein